MSCLSRCTVAYVSNVRPQRGQLIARLVLVASEKPDAKIPAGRANSPTDRRAISAARIFPAGVTG